MFLFVSHLEVPDEDRTVLERHLRDRARRVDGFPGFLYLQLLAPEAGSVSHAFVTAWESREAFQRYMKSEERASSQEREPEGLRRRMTVRHRGYRVLLDSRRDPEWIGRDDLGDAGNASA